MLIADEDHLTASVLQLLEVRCRVSDIDDAAQCPEVVDSWLLPMPSLEWSPSTTLFIGHLFITYKIVLTALPQNHLGSPFAMSKLLAAATIMPF